MSELATRLAPLRVVAVQGRPTGRGRPRGPLLHAVPGTDRTRSALCGARVGGSPRPWPQQRPLSRTEQLRTEQLRPEQLRPDPGTCPECAALVPTIARDEPDVA